MLDSEGETLEATSHALIVDGSDKSEKFKVLGDHIKKFRKKLQNDYVSRDNGIREIRKLRSEFESFNPEYDVSKCESCGDISDFLSKIKELNSNSENGEEKVLNTQLNNSSLSGFNMENVAVTYGGNFLGKLVDVAAMPMVPAEHKSLVTTGLAVGLPLLSNFGKLEKKSKAFDQTLVTLGAYEATNLVDILRGMLGFRQPMRYASSSVTRVNRYVAPQTSRVQPVSAVASKYVVV